MNDKKRVAFETAYGLGKVRVHFAVNHPDVTLPKVARERSPDGVNLALDYSSLFRLPSFKVTDEGLEATMMFGVRQYPTFIPWAAVSGLSQGGEPLESWSSEHTVTLSFDVAEKDRKWITNYLGVA